MEEKIIKEQTERMKEVLGDDFAKISDSIAVIVNGNKQTLTQHQENLEKIRKLEHDNADLVRANGALLQQIPMGESHEEEHDSPRSIDFHAFLNKDGSFKKGK